ncbi:hypothetical protein Tsubulata_028064 [Turnera subulata]|uniref:Uncharacterized protein n=1 Tax=Turnera subulata TaxID=218843 RepID=A0A9Q0FEW6_9ROSI|nr:hypothetical protein Tsubulata_028064 [Turnera subulata]
MAEIILTFALEETLKKVGSLAVEAYEAEDMLDEFGYEVLQQKVETTPTEKVRYFFSASSNPFAFRLGTC